MNTTLKLAYQEMLNATERYYKLVQKYDDNNTTKYNYLTQKRDKNGKFVRQHRLIALFRYPSSSYPYHPVPRKVNVNEMDDTYIKGIDMNENKYKCFRKSRIEPKTLAIKKIKD